MLLGSFHLLRGLRHRLLVGGAVGGDPVPRRAGARAGPCRGADGAGVGVLAPATVVSGGGGARVTVRPLAAAGGWRRGSRTVGGNPVPRGAGSLVGASAGSLGTGVGVLAPATVSKTSSGAVIAVRVLGARVRCRRGGRWTVTRNPVP